MSGKLLSARSSRPVRGPVSWIIAIRRPSSSTLAISGSRLTKIGSVVVPVDPDDPLGPIGQLVEQRALTQSPAWNTTSAGGTCAHSSSGRSRARAGRWVSEMISSRIGVTVR